LAALAAQGRDIKLSEDRIEGYRHFINKLWNATRFALMHLSDFDPDVSPQDVGHLSLADRWIMSRLNRLVDTVTVGIDEYKFNDAANALYQFVWHEFCDWYLEIIKPVLYGRSGDGEPSETPEAGHYETTRFVLWSVLNRTLRLLQPFIPFVAEEIWDKLPGTEGSIMEADFPVTSKDRHDSVAEQAMHVLMGVVSGVRNIRGEMNVPPSLQVEVTVQSADKEVRALIKQRRDTISNLCKAKTLEVMALGERPPASATSVFGNAIIFVSLEGVIDFELEMERLNKEISKITKELGGIDKKLRNEDFLEKAPNDVVEKVREKGEKLTEKRNRLQENLEKVSQAAGNA
jgi:valyl-tRNA synthetase